MSEFLKDPYNRKVFDFVKDKSFHRSPTDQGQPLAIIYGAQPGAGKSGIKGHLINEYPNIAVLDGDEYRKLHPNYESIARSDPDNMPHKTQPFVYELLDHLKQYAHKHKKSYALETTFHDGPKTEQTLAEAKRNGFKTELHVLAVNPKISYLSTLSRYEIGQQQGSVGRLVDKEIHYDRAKKNVNALSYCVNNNAADSITLYRRRVADQRSSVTIWQKNPKEPVQDFLTERTRSLKPQEQDYYKKVAQDVLSHMEGRKAPPDQINAFKKDFSDLLSNHQQQKGLSK
ncbi:zeta toxin family protein [Larkinella sp. GY13]|uniref:zeta toxin family protein n=1 Tax=Larkinella sp. GY13 TaxID=3453720 RepID=UPI003EE93A5E